MNPNDDFTQGAEVYAAVSDARLEVCIGIEHSTSPLRVRAALLHELVHAVVSVYGGGEDLGEPLVAPGWKSASGLNIPLPHCGSGPPFSMSWSTPELALASGLFQVLVDNPVSTAFILAAEPAQTPENKENDSKPVRDGNEQRAQSRFKAHESSAVTLWAQVTPKVRRSCPLCSPEGPFSERPRRNSRLDPSSRPWMGALP